MRGAWRSPQCCPGAQPPARGLRDQVTQQLKQNVKLLNTFNVFFV